MAFFCLIFLTGGPYTLWSSHTVSTILMSPVMTSVLGPVLLPLSLPVAVEQGWVIPLRTSRDPLLLRPGMSILRHAMSGLVLAFLCVPFASVVAFILSPMGGLTFVMAMATYIAVLAAFSLPSSILLFCTDANLNNMKHLFRGQPMWKRFLRCACC